MANKNEAARELLFQSKLKEFFLEKGAEVKTFLNTTEYTFDTIYGKLEVTLRNTTAFMRFLEPERPPKDLGHNVYSGKYNHHFYPNNKAEVMDHVKSVYNIINSLVPQIILFEKSGK